VGVILGFVAVALIFAIAAAVVGREARRLAAKAPGRVFEFEAAVTWVCDHVGDHVAAVLSPDDVRRILDWHLEFFRIKGVSSNGSSPRVEGPVVMSAAESVSFVLDKAEADGRAYTPEQVHAVLDAQMTYLESIGAVGQVDDPDEEQG